MAADRLKQIVLGALLVLLAVFGYRALTNTSVAPSAASNERPTTARAERTIAPGETAPDVHLDALEDERSKPVAADRNLFRFKPKAPPPPPPSAARAPEMMPPPVAVPTGPPPPPPITLKFVAIVEAPEQSLRIAVLSDGTGATPIYGREGDAVLGRYRILKIGTESVEIAYLDGRGRQAIRLSGQ